MERHRYRTSHSTPWLQLVNQNQRYGQRKRRPRRFPLTATTAITTITTTIALSTDPTALISPTLPDTLHCFRGQEGGVRMIHKETGFDVLRLPRGMYLFRGDAAGTTECAELGNQPPSWWTDAKCRTYRLHQDIDLLTLTSRRNLKRLLDPDHPMLDERTKRLLSVWSGYGHRTLPSPFHLMSPYPIYVDKPPEEMRIHTHGFLDMESMRTQLPIAAELEHLFCRVLADKLGVQGWWVQPGIPRSYERHVVEFHNEVVLLCKPSTFVSCVPDGSSVS
jgi:hypothetical protein